MRFISTVVLLFGLLALAQDNPHAAEAYEVGKQRYDAKDYAGALVKFDVCIVLEPGKARWHYNRGLTLKKLGRDAEAVTALMESRRLDPQYKQSEIDQKLSELAPPSSSSSSPRAKSGSGFEVSSWLVAGLGALAIVFAFFWFRTPAGAPAQASLDPGRAPAQLDPAAFTAVRQALARLGPKLTRLEHVMSLGEDAEARGQLDRASAHFQQARRGIALARSPGTPADLAAAVQRSEAAADQAQARLQALHGAAFDVARGPAAGCFFCARPLPTPESAQRLTLQQGAREHAVVTCASCARKVGPHQAPPVTLLQNGEHWAKQGLDPYTFFYSGTAPFTEAPLSSLRRTGADLSSLAQLAGAVALGAVGAAVISRVVDLDALVEADAASVAAAAAARSASSRRSDRELREHS